MNTGMVLWYEAAAHPGVLKRVLIVSLEKNSERQTTAKASAAGRRTLSVDQE
jgi:hypothetical protein